MNTANPATPTATADTWRSRTLLPAAYTLLADTFRSLRQAREDLCDSYRDTEYAHLDEGLLSDRDTCREARARVAASITNVLAVEVDPSRRGHLEVERELFVDADASTLRHVERAYRDLAASLTSGAVS